MSEREAKRERERERERKKDKSWTYVGVVGIMVETAVVNSSSSKLCIFNNLAIIADPKDMMSH